MARERRFLVDVGIKDLPFPMRVVSRLDPEGQPTIANISVSARIMREFEARWIDKFIQIIHRHRDRIGTRTLSENIMDYLKELEATTVKIDFTYPYFVEKRAWCGICAPMRQGHFP
jgi:GTP cyclohydrolase I